MTVCRLLHLAIIHEASNYIKTMIDLSRNTEFLNVQNDQRQVCVPHCALVSSQAFFFFFFSLPFAEVKILFFPSQPRLLSTWP